MVIHGFGLFPPLSEWHYSSITAIGRIRYT